MVDGTWRRSQDSSPMPIPQGKVSPQPLGVAVVMDDQPLSRALGAAISAVRPPASGYCPVYGPHPGGWVGVDQVVVCPGTDPFPSSLTTGWQTPAVEIGSLFQFGTATPAAMAAIWGTVNDGVMGGVSASSLSLVTDPEDPGQQVGRFAGTVSTAQGGGFASVRSRTVEPPFNLTDWQGIQLHLRGDGQRYKLILRDQTGWDSLAYAASFDTEAGVWIRVDIPFTTFRPTFRARTVATAPPLALGQICSVQLMLSKFEYDGDLNPQFQPGAFGLDLWEMAVYRPMAAPTLVAIALTPEQAATYTQALAGTDIPHRVVLAPGEADITPQWLRTAVLGL